MYVGARVCACVVATCTPLAWACARALALAYESRYPAQAVIHKVGCDGARLPTPADNISLSNQASRHDGTRAAWPVELLTDGGAACIQLPAPVAAAGSQVPGHLRVLRFRHRVV